MTEETIIVKHVRKQKDKHNELIHKTQIIIIGILQALEMIVSKMLLVYGVWQKCRILKKTGKITHPLVL